MISAYIIIAVILFLVLAAFLPQVLKHYNSPDLGRKDTAVFAVWFTAMVSITWVCSVPVLFYLFYKMRKNLA